MEFTNILFEKEDGIAIITLNRPPMNPLNRQILRELRTALKNIRDDPSVRVLIMTGAGEKAFAAGADVKEFKGATPAEMREFSREGQRFTSELEDIRIPVIAAINGYALGGGNELAMSADLRIAAENARFGQPEINLGLIPGWGGCVRLPRLIGATKAMELILTGDMIDAQEAARLGLVNMVVPQQELMSAAKELAKKLISKPRIALQQGKSVVKTALEIDKESALALEAESFAVLFSTEDAQGGVTAFLEKRKAEFKGR